MCQICGCDDHDPFRQQSTRRISLETDLLAKNDRLAEAVRARLVHDQIIALNMIGAPGAGKTSLLEHTLRALPELPITVIEGDQATDHDAKRIAATGRRVVQVNTGAGCHLEATMIERGLAQITPEPRSLLFVENVGNLVCPALFDLGEHAKVVVMAVTEGEDKPLKYPHIYRAAAAMVLTKMDLARHAGADVQKIIENARHVNPDLDVFPVAAKLGRGLPEWCGWLRARLDEAE
jgi:hydrogenase nickel incorporation protein HypB